MPRVRSDENTTSTDAPLPEESPSPSAAPASEPQPTESMLSQETPAEVPHEPVALPGPEDHPALAEHVEPVASEPAAWASEEQPPEPEVSEQPAAEAGVQEAEEPELEPVAEAESEVEPEPQPEPVEEPEPAAALASRAEEVADEQETEAEDEAEPAEAGAEAAPAQPPAPETNKKWYVVKVTSGREESIKQAIERKVKIEGLEDSFGQVAIPVEEFVEKKKVSVKDKKTGQKVTQERNVVKKRKKFPGYLFAEVEFNDRILYLFRETSGVGDFVGATHHRAPTPMTDREVQSMLTGVAGPKEPGTGKRPVKVKLDYEKGDKVKVKDGAFAGSEAEVKEIIMPKDPTDTPKVKVVVTIWGRPVEMEMDYWHVDKA